jgi:hypothetical protein
MNLFLSHGKKANIGIFIKRRPDMPQHPLPTKWLDMFCPDESCLTEEERIMLASPSADKSNDKRSLLDLFCPHGSCEITSASQLP